MPSRLCILTGCEAENALLGAIVWWLRKAAARLGEHLLEQAVFETKPDTQAMILSNDYFACTLMFQTDPTPRLIIQIPGPKKVRK
jgi:hypothetical protein